MNDELVHVAGRLAVSKTSNAIAASFGGTEGVLKQRRVSGRGNHEIVGHFLESCAVVLRSVCLLFLSSYERLET